MLDNIQLGNILFLDIETVPQFPNFEVMPTVFQKLWEHKAQYFRKEDETAADLYSRAGIYAEFGKIICISVGYFSSASSAKQFRIKSFYGDDERTVLQGFVSLLSTHFNKKEHTLCAHNGKEFDYPFIARRLVVNGMKLPALLDNATKKPWEVSLLDTMELWKFGDYKNYTSLQLLAAIFNIPTPKDDIDGSKVYQVYWEEKNLQRIVTYCQKDVLTVAQLLLRFKGNPLLEEKEVIIV